jgi:hypothetical protein
LQIKPTQMKVDVRNTSCCYARIPGTSIKRSHSRIEVPFQKWSKFDTPTEVYAKIFSFLTWYHTWYSLQYVTLTSHFGTKFDVTDSVFYIITGTRDCGQWLHYT